MKKVIIPVIVVDDNTDKEIDKYFAGRNNKKKKYKMVRDNS